MARKYYTVSEFAEVAGVSTQTIYQQLKQGRLRNYGRKVDGKQKIKAEALSLYQQQTEAGAGDPVAQEPSQSDEVRLLRELLAEKDKRIDDLQQALMREHETLRQQQEIMREEIETIKGQITAQYLLHGEIAPRDPDPVPPEADLPEDPQETAEKTPDVPQQDPEEPRAHAYKKSPGILSRLFSRERG